MSTPTDEKAFADLRARFALAGRQLHRTDPADGRVTYYSTRWGLVRELPTIEDAERFLAQVSGGANA